MSWASRQIEELRAGRTVKFRPHGNSMKGKISSGQLCTVEPVGDRAVEVGDIVLTKVNGRVYLHLVKAIRGGQYLIGNNLGRLNGWTSTIYGICTKVDL